MKNKRKQPKSSQKQHSYESRSKSQHSKSKHKQSLSVVYESNRNSSIIASPRPAKMMEKYKTYIQFISNNKISTDSYHVHREGNLGFKNKMSVTPVPRKNSLINYQKGRKSAMGRQTQPSSPMSSAPTKRNFFQKSQPHSSRPESKIQFSHHDKINKNSSKEKNNQIRSHMNSYEGEKMKKAANRSNNRNSSLGEDNYEQNEGRSKVQKNNQKKNGNVNKNKKTGNKNAHKSSLESENIEKSDKQQEKLCEKLFQGIQFYRDLGRGAHALVRSAVDWNNKRKIAIKVYDKSELSDEQIRSIERQIQILMSLSHPNIIKLYEIIQTFKTVHNYLYQFNLMLEYGGGNSLDQYIKSKPQGHLSQREAKMIFRQVLDAVKYLHDKNVTHRDIKSENILLNKHLNLKIIDFGFSLIVHQTNKNINTYCGTPTYMAPEVVSKTPHNPQLSDRWSVGILLFNMLNGHCPFRAATQKQLFAKINKGEFEYTKKVDELAKDLISKLMAKNPNERICLQEAILHPWLIK